MCVCVQLVLFMSLNALPFSVLHVQRLSEEMKRTFEAEQNKYLVCVLHALHASSDGTALIDCITLLHADIHAFRSSTTHNRGAEVQRGAGDATGMYACVCDPLKFPCTYT